ASQPLSIWVTQSGTLQGVSRSPLTDSNRRPPPYHGSSEATGGSRWQRIWLAFAVHGSSRFAGGCHRLQPPGSIKAPSFVVGFGYIRGSPAGVSPSLRPLETTTSGQPPPESENAGTLAFRSPRAVAPKVEGCRLPTSPLPAPIRPIE